MSLNFQPELNVATSEPTSAPGTWALPGQPLPPGWRLPATRWATVSEDRIHAAPTTTPAWSASGRRKVVYIAGTPRVSVRPATHCPSPGSGRAPDTAGIGGGASVPGGT